MSLLDHMRKLSIETSPIAELHERLWGTQTADASTRLPPASVRRDTPAPQHIRPVTSQIPRHYTALSGMEPLTSCDNISHIFVRQEYVEALHTINNFSKDPRNTLNHGFDTSDDLDSFPTESFDIFTPGDKDGFEDRGGGVAILGQNGTGKSMFLRYVLYHRLVNSRTTIWRSGERDLIVFTGDGAFVVPEPTSALCRELSFHLPGSTWCLVDSNVSSPGVAGHIMDLNVFVVQATCAGHGGLDWMGHTSRITTRYFLKPWSLPELIAARDTPLGSASQLSEAEIATNFDRYGPTPRAIFTEASPLHFHYSALDFAAQLQSSDALGEAVYRMKRNESKGDIYKLLVIEPSVRRDIPRVSIKNRYAANVLETGGHQRVPTLVDTFYAPVEYVLQSVILQYFRQGGSFPVGVVNNMSDEDERKTDRRAISRYIVPSIEHYSDRPNTWLRIGFESEPPVHISTDQHLAFGDAIASPVVLPTPFTPFTPYELVPMTPVAAPARQLVNASQKQTDDYYRWLAHPAEVPPPRPSPPPPKNVKVHVSADDPDAPQGDSDTLLAVTTRNPLRSGFNTPRSCLTPPFDFLSYNANDHSAIVFEAFFAQPERDLEVSTRGLQWLMSKGVKKISYVAVILGPRPNTVLQFKQNLVGVEMEIFVSLHDRYGKPWCAM
ncbi:hypothetical protein BXZ70DRAFT_496593 [Cristinia sonorae]|uniref:Uncharacterized protein n=1 Tax=Cristinia sonorae TaxID=1940300 RepID=A0A8K0XLZ5_9AGAR|nr:hypothetical protein BXZ70DRAFT_496593 [Cristinia sonorae]